jgi:hypothetical protein
VEVLKETRQALRKARTLTRRKGTTRTSRGLTAQTTAIGEAAGLPARGMLITNADTDVRQSYVTPKILVVATCHWVATARLATALVDAGCDVEAVCPRGHPLFRTRGPSRIYLYNPLVPLRSVDSALETSQPDFLVPCDDIATAHLHALHKAACRSGARGATRRALLERSLGDPRGFEVVTARARLMRVAEERGVLVPCTQPIHSQDELNNWLHRYGFPAVLKTDGTFGGRGIQIVRTQSESDAAWQLLTSPPPPLRAIKRALVNRDWSDVRRCALRRRRTLSVQRFIAGQDANSTVAAWQGEVLASITAGVLQTLDEQGPASVLQLFQDEQIDAAVKTIVRELKLTGLLGFDFVIEEATGRPYLIEMNPRATQVGHLNLGSGRDLAGALAAVLTEKTIPRTVCNLNPGDTIALFPQEWVREPTSPFLAAGYHDVPWDNPDLLRACLHDDMRYKLWSILSSLVRRR